MRIKILFFLMILLSANVFSQRVDEDQVPKDVLIAIETVYSGVKVKTWELKDNNYFATLKVEGQTGIAEVTPEGKWLSTKFNVSEKELPSSVTTYMSDNFDGYKIKIAQYIEDNEEKSYYVLTIQKKGISSGDEYELTFDIKGNLTNTTAPESAKTEKKKSDEDIASAKRDKVNKKEAKNDDEEDSKNEDKDTKSTKKTSSSKETTASKSKATKTNEDEDTNDDKPVKKNATNSKSTNGSSSSNTKTKKMKLSDGDDEGTSSNGAPSIVKKQFEKKYPHTENATWKKIDSNYVVSFVLRDVDQKAEFTPDAKLVSTTTIMDPKNLFRPTENYLEKNYNKYKVISAEKVVYNSTYVKLYPEKKLKSYYVVKISEKIKHSKKPKISTIFFDSKGAMDRIEEGDFEDEDQGDDNDSHSKKKSKNDDDDDE